MTVDRGAILSETPHWYVAPYANPLGIAHEDLAVVVRGIVAGTTWRGADSDGLRLVAYGLYSGALSESEATASLAGSDEELILEVRSAIAPLSPFGADRLAKLVRAALHDRLDGEIRPRDPDEGWAVTLLDLVAVVRPHVLPTLIALDDPSHVIRRWTLQRWAPNSSLVSYAEALMSGDDRESWLAAAALLAAAARAFINRNDSQPSVPAAPANARLIVSGILLTEIYDGGRRESLPVQARKRWNAFVTQLRANVASLVQNAKDARALRAAGDENDTTLIALILGVANGEASRTFGAAGESLVRAYFRPLVKIDAKPEQEALPYLAPIVANDLAQIWYAIRGDVGFFEALRAELRCDEYAFAFTYAHYLTDRSRGMVLAAIAASAGKRLGDAALVNAAISLAEDLRRLPEGVSAAFDDETLQSLRENTGLDLPSK